MQTLDIISVNLWQILISLANLLLLFWILKKVFYGPVKKLLADRQAAIDEQISAAEEARKSAEESRVQWEEALQGAREKAGTILQTATEEAARQEEKILSQARETAAGILRRAEAEAEGERRKAAEGIKREIVEVSGALTEKMLEREVKTEDHRALIDSFLNEIGEKDD